MGAPSKEPASEERFLVVPEGWMRSVDTRLERIEKLLEMRPVASAPAPAAAMYVTRRQAAEISGYSLRTIGRLIQAGRLVASGPNLDRIKRFELDRMMDETAKRRGQGAVEQGDAEAQAMVDRIFDED